MKQIYAHYSMLPVSGSSGGSFVSSSPTSPKSSPKRGGDVDVAAEDIFYLNQGII